MQSLRPHSWPQCVSECGRSSPLVTRHGSPDVPNRRGLPTQPAAHPFVPLKLAVVP